MLLARASTIVLWGVSAAGLYQADVNANSRRTWAGQGRYPRVLPTYSPGDRARWVISCAHDLAVEAGPKFDVREGDAVTFNGEPLQPGRVYHNDGSVSPSAVIEFAADPAPHETGSGFSFVWRCTEPLTCAAADVVNETAVFPSGTIVHPDPGLGLPFYANDEEVCWEVVCAGSAVVEVVEMDVHDGDELRVNDAVLRKTVVSPMPYRTAVPEPVTVNAGVALVTFNSDYAGRGGGFNLSWACGEEGPHVTSTTSSTTSTTMSTSTIDVRPTGVPSTDGSTTRVLTPSTSATATSATATSATATSATVTSATVTSATAEATASAPESFLFIWTFPEADCAVLDTSTGGVQDLLAILEAATAPVTAFATSCEAQPGPDSRRYHELGVDQLVVVTQSRLSTGAVDAMLPSLAGDVAASLRIDSALAQALAGTVVQVRAALADAEFDVCAAIPHAAVLARIASGATSPCVPLACESGYVKAASQCVSASSIDPGSYLCFVDADCSFGGSAAMVCMPGNTCSIAFPTTPEPPSSPQPSSPATPTPGSGATAAPASPSIPTSAPNTLEPGAPVGSTAVPGTFSPATRAPTPAAPATGVPNTLEPGAPPGSTTVPGTFAPATGVPNTLEPWAPPGSTTIPGTFAPATGVLNTLGPGAPAGSTAIPGTFAPATGVPNTLEPGAPPGSTTIPGTFAPEKGAAGSASAGGADGVVVPVAVAVAVLLAGGAGAAGFLVRRRRQKKVVCDDGREAEEMVSIGGFPEASPGSPALEDCLSSGEPADAPQEESTEGLVATGEVEGMADPALPEVEGMADPALPEVEGMADPALPELHREPSLSALLKEATISPLSELLEAVEREPGEGRRGSDFHLELSPRGAAGTQPPAAGRRDGSAAPLKAAMASKPLASLAGVLGRDEQGFAINRPPAVQTEAVSSAVALHGPSHSWEEEEPFDADEASRMSPHSPRACPEWQEDDSPPSTPPTEGSPSSFPSPSSQTPHA